jgi:hypothetical protein
MSGDGETAITTAPRTIVISNDELVHGNIEAWMNIIASYRERHPDHAVVIFYEGEPVNNLQTLFRKGVPNKEAFQLVVETPDGFLKDVPKLFRLLVEGAGPNYRRYIEKELHKVLDLF